MMTFTQRPSTSLRANGFCTALLALAMLGFVPAASAAAHPLPRPDHIVIVIEENKPFSKIIGNADAPFINALAQRGVLFTNSFGVTHPSQPNYLALFSGSTRGVRDDACPLEMQGENLASALIAHGLSFATYSESMPQAGFTECSNDAYMRKHNPAADWQELAAFNQPFSAFPQDFSKLPTVSLLVPDQRNDMHDGSIAQGDAWLAQNIERYAQWALAHNSLLIVTWDEDDNSEGNRIATLFVGATVQPGKSAQRINHYTVLRTISAMYGLPLMGKSAGEKMIADVWKTPG